jgi:hypothetical protein
LLLERDEDESLTDSELEDGLDDELKELLLPGWLCCWPLLGD